MLHHRIAAAGVSVGLVLLVASPGARADTSTPSSVAPAPSDPVVVSGPNGLFTVTLPGVGSLSFTVDPTTGQATGLTALPAAGFTSSTPKVTEDGVKVSFTDSVGTVQTVTAEIESEDGATVVTAEQNQNADDQGENDQHDGEDHPSSPRPTVPPSGEKDDHETPPTSMGHHEHDGDHESTSGGDHEHSGDHSSDSGSSQSDN